MMRLALWWPTLAALFAPRPKAIYPIYRGHFRTLDSASGPSLFLARRLELSAIQKSAALHAGIRSMTVGAARAADYTLPRYSSDGFLIPYYDAHDRLIPGRWRWRNDPDRNLHSKFIKYGQPQATGCFLYLPRVKGLNWQKVLADPKIEVFIVEGELKALSLSLRGVPAIAVGGVWNWTNQHRLLPELKQLAAGGRELLILFDSDMWDKPLIAGACCALVRALTNAEARTSIIELPQLKDPESPTKTGADDFIRLNPALKDEELRKAFHDFAGELPETAGLYRLNAEYVIDEFAARVVRLYTREGIVADRQNEIWKRADFCGLIENETVMGLGRDGKPKSVNVGELWLRWPARNRVVGRLYRPVSQNVEDFTYVYENGRRYLNEFRGWASLPEANPDLVANYWTELLDHLFRAQSAETPKQTALRSEARKWFEQWWAYPVQHPGAKMMSAAILSGHQGGGKDMVGRAVAWAVYGPHYRLISPAELNSNFNASFMHAVSLIHAQELTSTNTKRNFNELLKAWITSSSVHIEQKFEKAYYSNVAFNFYMTTNPANSIQLEWDDRRYFVWRIADVKIEDMLTKKWVDDFHVVMESPEGRAALHHHLLEEVDCKDFDPNLAPPITEAKQFTQSLSTNEAESWVARFAAEQRETNLEGAWAVEEVRLKTPGFHEKEFQAAFHQYFKFVGRTKVKATDAHGRPTRTTRGLWVLKPTAEDIKQSRFVTLAQAKERYQVEKEKGEQKWKVL